MAQHLAHEKVKRALAHQTPPSTEETYHLGDKVLVWREKLVENCISELIGLYIVCIHDAAARTVLVQKVVDSPHVRYTVDQVKRFLEPNPAARTYMNTLHKAFFRHITLRMT